MPLRSRLKPAAVALADRVPQLLDLYRAVVHPRWELANWRDFNATRRSLHWLREVPSPSADAPVVLLVIHREDIFDIKKSAMLGAALKLRGVRPVILARSGRVPRILRYARAFGIRSVRHREEFPVSPEAARAIRARADELMASELDLESVKAWTHDGHPLGERVLSTVIRATLEGEPNLAEPRVRGLLRRALVEILTNYHQAVAILDAERPRIVLASEVGYGINGPLVDEAIRRGADVIEASPFVRDDALMLKRMSATVGRAPAASVAGETLERLEERRWTEADEAALAAVFAERYGGHSALHSMYQRDTRAAGREEIHGHFGLDPDRSLAVVFSHVLWDASFFFGKDLFDGYARWMEATVRAAIANPGVNWLIKTHPANAFRLAHGDVSGPVAEVDLVRRNFRELPEHVRLVLPETPISSLSLYHCADYGVTVRGTAGLEMACFGKPVVTGGSGHYSGLGFTHDSGSREEYLGRLAAIQELPPPAPAAVERARRYTLALFDRRPWVMRSFDMGLHFGSGTWHPLDRNLVARARSLEEARAYGDLDRWADWALDREAADYLEPEAPAPDSPVATASPE